MYIQNPVKHLRFFKNYSQLIIYLFIYFMSLFIFAKRFILEAIFVFAKRFIVDD